MTETREIIIRPGRYRQFGPPEGATFCLVTNSGLLNSITIEHSGGYPEYRVFPYDEEGQIELLLRDSIPEPAHVLVVSPNCFFRSPRQELIGPKRKLLAMACNSTPTPMHAVAHFLDMIERTRPDRQQMLVDRFFDRGPKVDHMEIVDKRHGTRAVFEHLNGDYEWNIQAGFLDWGEQQISPSGEISVLPADIWQFDARLALAINGEVALRGLPILHSGEVSFLREDQRRIFEALRSMHVSPIIAKVSKGVIVEVRAVGPEGKPALHMLERMFYVDSRYRTIWELGFAVNTTLEVIWDNMAMNEVYGGTEGCLHIGLGLTPYTQYHLDIICPDTAIYAPDGELLFGGDKQRQMVPAD
ncbi:MAG TPA: hypothetical protein VEI03_15160 [Stellaceae bacterium]|nr:hypothetical protein [Stellaceae bacterium]